MKILNKFIWSKKEPSNKNDIWFDGSTWRMYTEEAWQSFTLPVDAADKVAKVIENASEVYQEKLNAGYGIIIEGNTISVDDSNVWEAIETLQQNKVEQIQLNDYVPLDRYASTSKVLMGNISELASTKLNKADVATINGKSLIEGGNIVIDNTEIKQQITELFDKILQGKQDTIEDLETIRSGAAKGATAAQNVSSSNANYATVRREGFEWIISPRTQKISEAGDPVFYKSGIADAYDVKQELIKKVDKVVGKQLSTEDFTTALKQKLQGLSNYDDSTLTSAINSLQSQINTLVSGNVSSAIDTFNEIIAFLDGVKDTQDLAGIIASIEQLIAEVNSSLSAELAKKPNKTDIATINGQSLIEGGNIKIEGVGTGDGAELVEFIYLFGQELSEEQKATNAASYAKMASGGNYIPYVKTSEGINVSVSLWGIEDGVLLLPIESGVLPLLGMSKILICIDATGQIQVEPLLIDTHVLSEEDFASYDTLREKAVAIVGENGINLSPIRVIGSTGYLGWTDEIIVQDDYVTLIYTTDYGVKYQIMGYGGDQKGIIKEIIAGGIIYLNVTDPTSQEAMNNKMVNLFYGMPHTFKIKVVNEDTNWYYTPLMIKSEAVVIFRNNTMEGWLLNSDGTTTLSK